MGVSFDYVIDNDPNLHYKKILGAGGYGSVHEVISIVKEAYLGL